MSTNELHTRADGLPESIVVMGVSGSGKSTIGLLLAERLEVDFFDGDDLHPQDNVLRMAAGYPLGDEERVPWLHLVGQRLHSAHVAGHSLVMACSALKHSYRDILRGHAPSAFFVFLDGPAELVQERVLHRNHEFMPASLLASQFRSLEPLSPEENGIRIDINMTPEVAVELVLGERMPKRHEAQSPKATKESGLKTREPNAL